MNKSVKDFLNNKCEYQEGVFTPTTVIYDSYCDWCIAIQHTPMSFSQFIQAFSATLPMWKSSNENVVMTRRRQKGALKNASAPRGYLNLNIVKD
jgi:phage/plasmid-associated DNA primase